MKLLHKYNRINMALTVFILLFTGIIYYYAISIILTHQVDKALLVEEHEILDYVKLNKHLPQVFQTNHQQISFIPIRNTLRRKFIDTTYRDLKDHELEPARAIISKVMVAKQQYQILVIQSKVETEDLLKIIFLITIGLIIILLVALFLLNRLILSRIWKPFYKILNQLRCFNLADHQVIISISSDIDEFTDLNQAVNTMELRVQNDYQHLKAFTENAAHELMTPIAVMNSKLDTMLQTGQFSNQQSKLLNDLYQTVTRLTRLNKSMLLLAKVENNLIQDQQRINLKELILNSVSEYEELFISSKISIVTHLEDREVQASKLLTEVLLTNLIINAIRHNCAGGTVVITLQQDRLIISNTGKNEPLNTDRLFKRFQKSDDSEGIGLGLTICKQICDNYGYKLNYVFLNNRHSFTVLF